MSLVLLFVRGGPRHSVLICVSIYLPRCRVVKISSSERVRTRAGLTLPPLRAPHTPVAPRRTAAHTSHPAHTQHTGTSTGGSSRSSSSVEHRDRQPHSAPWARPHEDPRCDRLSHRCSSSSFLCCVRLCANHPSIDAIVVHRALVASAAALPSCPACAAPSCGCPCVPVCVVRLCRVSSVPLVPVRPPAVSSRSPDV